MGRPACKLFPALALLVCAAFSAWGVSAVVLGRAAPHEAASGHKDFVAGGAKSSNEAPSPRFPVIIRRPPGPERVDTGVRDLHGEPVRIHCATCHATREPNPQNRSSADLDQFHKGLHMAHGGLSCLSCHNAHDYDSLRLADGTRLAFGDAMRLCAQCHGPQARDYERGAHGGMTGYWDLSRGPRRRNHCIDCHDPHAPAYPEVMPVFPPRER